MVRGARAADRRPSDQSPPPPLERAVRRALRGRDTLRSREGCTSLDGPPVEPFDVGDELPGGVVANGVGAICPDETALYIPPAGSRGRRRRGSLGTGGPLSSCRTTMDDPERTKAGLRVRTAAGGARLRAPTRARRSVRRRGRRHSRPSRGDAARKELLVSIPGALLPAARARHLDALLRGRDHSYRWRENYAAGHTQAEGQIHDPDHDRREVHNESGPPGNTAPRDGLEIYNTFLIPQMFAEVAQGKSTPAEAVSELRPRRHRASTASGRPRVSCKRSTYRWMSRAQRGPRSDTETRDERPTGLPPCASTAPRGSALSASILLSTQRIISSSISGGRYFAAKAANACTSSSSCPLSASSMSWVRGAADRGERELEAGGAELEG